jgi:FPC/CPF motif-containing protein YcgG
MTVIGVQRKGKFFFNIISKSQNKCVVADNMACPKDDKKILQFLYDFVAEYRLSSSPFHSAAVIFKGPDFVNEQLFELLLWQRLQSISRLDRINYNHDPRVDSDPSSAKFSFSIMEEAFFIIGLHPGSSRPARTFKYPVLTFNPHAQFEYLRETKRYEKLKNIVRKRDLAYAGSINPMLKNFGDASETFQYSGKVYSEEWQCPLKF